MKKYSPILNASSPEIQLRMPETILKDLALRAEENGRSIEFEISMRLARSLERDLEMIAEDNDMAILAFEEFQKQQEAKKHK